MENMSMQKRLFLAAFICLGIMLAQGLLFPPDPLPPPSEGGTDEIAAEGGTDESPPEQAGSGEAPGTEGGTKNPPATPTPSTPSPDVVDRVEHRVANDMLAITLSNAGEGMIADVEPLAEKFITREGEGDKPGKGVDFLLLDGNHTLELGFHGDDTDFAWSRRAREVVQKDERSFTLREAGEEVEVVEHFEILDGYEAAIEVTVTNRSGAEQNHRLRVRNFLGEPDESSRYNVHRALCRTSEDLEDFDIDDVEEAPERIKGGVQWVGLDSSYFLAAIVPDGEALTGCEVSADVANGGRNLLSNAAMGKKTTLAPGESHTYRFGLYLGAKEPERLRTFTPVPNSTLEEAVDWGYFGAVSEFLGKKMLALLRWFFDLSGIWGVAIIMLTVCVKLVLLPLTLKQYKSMRKMREIQPEMEAIRKKYADDKPKQTQEIQALFSRSGTNPLSGCLPMVIQFPVWIALYAMLGTAVELYHEPFLWLTDLTSPDHLYILPIGMGALMFVQMRIQPQTGDSQQQKMMKWLMPGFFTFMMWFMPSGLGVYIFANLVLSLIQSFIQLRPDKGWTKSKAEASESKGDD
jgi:YidC/Oxa1 family membrane protein insertase